MTFFYFSRLSFLGKSQKNHNIFQVKVETFKNTLLWMCWGSPKGKQRATMFERNLSRTEFI